MSSAVLPLPEERPEPDAVRAEPDDVRSSCQPARTADGQSRGPSAPNTVALRGALTSIPGDRGLALSSFFHSGDVVRVLVPTVTVQRWTDAQEELERVTEIVAVVAIKSVRAVIDGELRSEADVDAVTM